MRARTPRACAHVTLRWDDYVLVEQSVRAGTVCRIGPDPRSSYAIPWKLPCSIRVDAGGVVFVTEAGARVLSPNETLRHPLGALTLSVRSAREEGPSTLLGRLEGAGLALLWGLIVAAHLLAVALSVPPAPSPAAGRELASPDPSSREAGTPVKAVPTLFSIETEPPPPLVAPLAEPPPDDSAMVFPEANGPLQSAEHPRRSGELARTMPADLRTGGTGRRADRREGPIGNPFAPRLPYAWSIRGAGNEPRPAREAHLEAFWPVSLALSSRAVIQERVAAPWGEREPVGRDDTAALGNMFGSEPADPLGAGLGAEERGPGGGGAAKGIGLGARGALGHGAGSGRGDGAGVPTPSARFSRDAGVGVHVPRAPSLETHVARDVVTRVLQRNTGLLRACAPSAATIELALSVSDDGTPADVVIEAEPELGPTRRACLTRAVSGLRFLPAGRRASRVSARLRL